MASELDGAVIVDFPLRGEWVAINSPGDRIPSHGTNILGQRFAFDFIRIDRRRGWHVSPASSLRANLIGFPIREAYGWGEPIHMPFDGEIVDAQDGYPERIRVVPIREIAVALKNSVTFDPSRIRSLTGNFVLARRGDIFTDPVRAYIRRQLSRVFSGPDGARARATILDEDTRAVKLTVNSRYPSTVPVSTVPPQVLLVLPRLPETLEYRFVGDTLVLLDIHAGTVVDFMEKALG